MTEKGATFLGFLAACEVPPSIMAIRALPFEPTIEGPWDALIFLGAVFLMFLPFSVLAAIVVGLPFFLVCRRFGHVTWWLALFGGALAGVFGALMTPEKKPLADLLVQYVSIGIVAGLTFWLVWKRSLRTAIS